MSNPKQETPLYRRVVNSLLILASPLFARAQKVPSGTRASEEAFELWYSLRTIAGNIELTKVISFTARDRANLTAALEIAHDLEHGAHFGPSPSIEDCDCAVASEIRALAGLLIAYGVEMTDAEMRSAENAA